MAVNILGLEACYFSKFIGSSKTFFVSEYYLGLKLSILLKNNFIIDKFSDLSFEKNLLSVFTSLSDSMSLPANAFSKIGLI